MLLSWLFQSKEFSSFEFSSTVHLYFRSLGALNYIRVWHDNSGQGRKASWFLKYIIVRDLQTMEKSYFICQQWFAVEKNEGRVRICSVLNECLQNRL